MTQAMKNSPPTLYESRLHVVGVYFASFEMTQRIVQNPEYHLKGAAKRALEAMEQLEQYLLDENMVREYGEFRKNYSVQMQELRKMLRDGTDSLPVCDGGSMDIQGADRGTSGERAGEANEMQGLPETVDRQSGSM